MKEMMLVIVTEMMDALKMNTQHIQCLHTLLVDCQHPRSSLLWQHNSQQCSTSILHNGLLHYFHVFRFSSVTF